MMDNVVVTIDKQQQNQNQHQHQHQQRTRSSRKGSPSSNGSKGSSPPSPQLDRITIVCDAPKSPSPKRAAVGIASSSNGFRSRGSSYNFSEDEQPLAPSATPPAPPTATSSAEVEHPETAERRNRSFDFGVSLAASTNSSVQVVPVPDGMKGNNGYYRLPPSRDSPAADMQRPDHVPEILPEAKSSPSVEKVATSKVSLRAAIEKEAPDSDSTDDEEEKHTAVANPSKTPVTFSAEAVVVKAPTNFNRLKSRSRLAEPPPPPPPPKDPAAAAPARAASPAANGKVEGTRPGTAPPAEAEEEDPLRDVDLPAKYRRYKFGYCSAFQLVALILLTALLVCSCTVTALRRHAIWSMELWKWVLMALVVLSGRLVSGWLMHVVVFFIERNFMWRKRVLYFVYGLRKGVQTAVWLTLALISWLLLFDRNVERSTKHHKALTYVTKVLLCFLIGAFVWLAKLLFVKVLASSYHVSTYFDRIQESLFSQYILEKLSGPPLEEGDEPRFQQSATFKLAELPGKGKKETQEPALSIDKLQQLNRRNVSAWNMKRLVMLVKQSKIATLTQTIDSSVLQDGTENEIQTEWQARAAAKEVFKNVAKPGSKQITLDDLLRFLTESEAKRALALFEGVTEAGGTITKKNLVNWVIGVYRERRSLALSLNDTKTAVDKLHQIINVITLIIILIIWLLVLGLATSHLLVVVSSQVLLIVFVFGNTCKTVFEAIIFLFVMHPYDVGDRCVIDGVQMVVEEMNILTTVFLRFDNEKIYYPNSVLANKPISNFYRSPDMNDAIEFTVDMSTPVEKIAALREKVARHISTKSAHWHNKSTIVVKEIENMNRMKMALWTTHTMNFQNNGERLIRKSELLIKLKTFFEELGIEYHLLPQEVTLSNYTSMETR